MGTPPRSDEPGASEASLSGLLALVTMLFVLFSSVEVPMPVDLQAWYALRGWPVLLTGLGLALYGFRISLAGKSPFGRVLLED